MPAQPSPALEPGVGGSSDVCTTSEAARLLGVSNTTVQLMVERGELRAWKTPGGHRRIGRAALEAVRASRSAHSSPGAAARTVEPLVVLMADPDAAVGERLRALDGPALVLRVLQAHDALEAMLMLERQRPDVLVAACRMPPVDGLELLRSVRRHAESDGLVAVLAGDPDEPALRARGGLPRGVVQHHAAAGRAAAGVPGGLPPAQAAAGIGRPAGGRRARRGRGRPATAPTRPAAVRAARPAGAAPPAAGDHPPARTAPGSARSRAPRGRSWRLVAAQPAPVATAA
jgi:excisionase family DNA binding protein